MFQGHKSSYSLSRASHKLHMVDVRCVDADITNEKLSQSITYINSIRNQKLIGIPCCNGCLKNRIQGILVFSKRNLSTSLAGCCCSCCNWLIRFPDQNETSLLRMASISQDSSMTIKPHQASTICELCTPLHADIIVRTYTYKHISACVYMRHTWIHFTSRSLMVARFVFSQIKMSS